MAEVAVELDQEEPDSPFQGKEAYSATRHLPCLSSTLPYSASLEWWQ